MTLSDHHITIFAQIQHLQKVKREIDLMIQSLRSLLPDRKPGERRPVYVLNPKTGKREEVPMGPQRRTRKKASERTEKRKS